MLARPAGRATNLTLLLALVLAFGTGVGAVAALLCIQATSNR
jgi:hypothetical protein